MLPAPTDRPRQRRAAPATRVPASRASAVVAASEPPAYPHWLRGNLRSGHTGKTGAVAIYKVIMACARDAAVRDFARCRRAAGRRHLRIIEDAWLSCSTLAERMATLPDTTLVPEETPI